MAGAGGRAGNEIDDDMPIVKRKGKDSKALDDEAAVAAKKKKPGASAESSREPVAAGSVEGEAAGVGSNEARANLSPKDWQARLRLQGFPAVAKYLQAANASRHNT